MTSPPRPRSRPALPDADYAALEKLYRKLERHVGPHAACDAQLASVAVELTETPKDVP